MIFYPLSTLILSGVHDILVITTPHEQPLFQRLLGDGANFGVNLRYAVQSAPNGLAQAFVIGRDFVGDESVVLVLGDNIFHGHGLGAQLNAFDNLNGAAVFAYWVANPSAYGVVQLDDHQMAVSIEEKPAKPKSNYAVPGLYFYDNHVLDIAAGLQPSTRGEYEITDVNLAYLEQSRLQVSVLPRGTAWLDTGTFDSLQDAGNFVRTLQKRQGLLVGCPEEAAWHRGLLSDDDLRVRGESLIKSGYGQYLLDLLDQEGASH